MSRNMSRALSALGGTLLVACGANAMAQWQPAGSNCYCAQPVTQACYQNVPVVEYQQVRQTVRKPIVETKYVEQPVTEYRQVYEQQTVEVPTISYQNVTEYQPVTRDNGQWITRYQSNPRISPCQYDNRNGILGALNRTGFAIRSAFTPTVTTQREYIPNVQTQLVPVTRQVAISGTRQMTYNVARAVPYTTTRRVAVNSVRYVQEDVVGLRPVTVMRSVPIGARTAYAFAPVISAAPRTVLQPLPDPLNRAAAPRRAGPRRTADSRNLEPAESNAPSDNDTEMFSPNGPGVKAENIRYQTQPRVQRSRSAATSAQRIQHPSRPTGSPAVGQTPSIVRVSGWRSHHRSVAGPVLGQPTIAVAGNER